MTYQVPVPMTSSARMLGYGFPATSSGYGTSKSFGKSRADDARTNRALANDLPLAQKNIYFVCITRFRHHAYQILLAQNGCFIKMAN